MKFSYKNTHKKFTFAAKATAAAVLIDVGQKGIIKKNSKKKFILAKKCIFS